MKPLSASSVARVPFCTERWSILAATGGTAVTSVRAGVSAPVSVTLRTAQCPESAPPTASSPPSGAGVSEVPACRRRVTASPPARGTAVSGSPDLSTRLPGCGGTERATTSQRPAMPSCGVPSVPGSVTVVPGADRSARSRTCAVAPYAYQTSRSALRATVVGAAATVTSAVTSAAARSTSAR